MDEWNDMWYIKTYVQHDWQRVIFWVVSCLAGLKVGLWYFV